jgi:hypothetical protein
MTKFLKLTGRVINTSFIQHIYFDKAAEKYSLYLSTVHHSGFLMLGSGSFNGVNNEICANKKDHQESYETIEKWVNSLECVSNKS